MRADEGHQPTTVNEPCLKCGFAKSVVEESWSMVAVNGIARIVTKYQVPQVPKCRHEFGKSVAAKS